MSQRYAISVIGLGYVGLPLAAALSLHHDVIGYDINKTRVAEIKIFKDRTGEIDSKTLKAANLFVTNDIRAIKKSKIFIIAVPTPIDRQKMPDLTAILSATRTVAGQMLEGSIVVYESTVYPGVTEEKCGPILEEVSGLVCGRDFWLGYSPERLNPGDKEHNLANITKVVSGQTSEVTELLAEVYGSINNGQVFKASNIRTAEAAKVIENAQRDINIAFVNEIAMIFGRLGLSTLDVLETAATKWNFLDFKPGLVGGHCIGVDPFYLAYKAQSVGVNPEVILAGRRINDNMGFIYAELVASELNKGERVLVLGITFKENVSDIRNTRVIDIVERLESLGFDTDIHDPRADPEEVYLAFKRRLVPLGTAARYNALIIAVNHREFSMISNDQFEGMLVDKGLILDLKGLLRGRKILPDLRLMSV